MPPYQVFCDPMVLRRIFSGLPDGRGMTTVDEISLSPASDCNSNNVAGSYNSTTSDAEFVQDNSDYQWFTEYGYSGREFCHRSVLSSGYDELARDLDSQLALADMEDFSAQEILSTLPTICCTEIQPERQGEMYASVSGSMMDESVSMSEPLFSPVKENPLPCTTNYSVDSLDCDCEDLVLTCQATNKDNYTIAFHGSGEGGDSLYLGDRERCMAASTTTWSKVVKPRDNNQQRHKSKAVSLPDLPTHPQHLSNSIAALGRCVKLFDIQNSGSLTSESYSGSGGDINSCFNKQENFSLLKLFIAQRNQTETTTHNDNDKRNNNPADWEESGCQYEDSLVKGESTGASTEESSSVERLFSECKSDSVCTCSMSSSSHKYNVNNNDSFEKDVVVKKHNVKVGTSTSDLSSATSTSNTAGCNTAVRPNALQACPVHCIDRSMQTSQRSVHQPTNKQQKEETPVAGSPVYVFYPNYTLPDLGFLHHHKVDLDKVLLTPLKYSPTLPPHPSLAHHKPLPRHHVTRHDIDQLKQKGLGHVMDWSSLTPLLPSECWSVLAELPQLKRHSHSRFENTRPQFTIPVTKDRQSPVPSEGKVPKGSVDSGVSDGTSGYRGSSTLLTESSETKQSNPLYVYDYSWTNEPVTPHKLKSNPELNKIDNKEKRLSMFEFTASILDDVFENNSVSKFLKGHNRKLQDHQKTPPNSPINQKSYQVNPNNLNDFYLGQAERIRESPDYESRKESLVEGVVCGVERLLVHKENAAEAALGSLCPALYALMSDGLKTNIDTPFGPINNSVWQVVEASAHQGLVTKALNDLVMKLNCEDVLSEGLIKFNAFIFGLLNVGGVEAWVSYMRTRESVLRKHYNPESVLLQASQGQALSRALTDRIISGLRPLSQVHFTLDLLYETKLLHTSLLQLMRVPVSPTSSTDSESALVRKIVQSLRCCGITNQMCNNCEQSYDIGDRRRRGVRPRSCVEVVGGNGEVVGSSRKRWSGVAMGSRLASAFDSLAEGSSPISSPEESSQNHGTGKFKSLQRKWELLSNKTSLCSPPASPVKTSVNTPGSAVKSRIPRPVTSPVRPDVGRSRIPRASRADGVDRVAGVGRPSSLPQSRGPPPSHPSTTRRAASSSSTRPSKKTQPPNNRYVVTLTHRLPSDSGHLAFNEGERLRLVLEVDDTWLLCCRGDRKGLVPRSAVI